MARESRQEKPINLVSSSGFCYSDVSSSHNPAATYSHLMNQMQSFESSNPELFNLTTGIEMLGFPSKNLHHRDGNSVMWKGFFNKSSNQGSSSKTINESASDFYQQGFNKPDFSTGFSETTSDHDNLIVAPDSAWQENRSFHIDDSSLRCVFPCEGNERPSQGLSLSLCSNKPTGIGLQSFELRETSHHHNQQDFRDGFLGKSTNLHHDQQQQQQQQQQILQEGFLGKAANLYQTQFQLKNSRFLLPTQELLNEFCSLETKQFVPPKQKPHITNQWEDENGASSSQKQSLYSLDLLELQKLKAKLLSMLEEVDRRYRQYCDQMKAVVSSFEEVAGTRSSIVYSALASKAMSRHFRCLRDGIVGQIQAIKKAMGEKDIVAPGTTKGDTPRLKLLDQTLRQQRAFQQMTMMESHPWRPQRGLPERSVSVLRAWLFEHFLHPYPSDVDKHILAHQTGLSRSQVSNWFINARVRLWKPMVEEMYLEETKEQDNIGFPNSDAVTSLDDNGRPKQNPQGCSEDQKPTPDQLIRHDSESLSSIINNPDKSDNRSGRNHEQQPQQQHQRQFGRVAESFGVIDLDFSSYNNDGLRQNFSNGVSLTLGLQQHDHGSGVGLSFSPASQHSLLFPKNHIEDQYSILDGEAQNLPYRNLMGAQLLHDLAG